MSAAYNRILVDHCHAEREEIAMLDEQAVASEANTLTPEALVDVLDRFADAWNRHDLEALMSFMADEAIFDSSSGSEIFGTRYQGRAAVRAGFARVLSNFPDVHFQQLGHFVAGNRGVSEWIFRGTRADGKLVTVRGCDIFTLAGDRILVKNSFLKNRSD
jgi:ketosteroid isomerase-like protein